MRLFLTSSIGGSYKENGIRIPCALDESNHFVDNLKKYWPQSAKCLILSSDPEDEELNLSLKSVYAKAFSISRFPFTEFEVCDRKNESSIRDFIYDYDVLILAGGHVPTQNRFFNRIHLRELLKNYNGIVIGISAGTMNCADIVYAQPELDGEAVDPQYRRFLDGLALTKINILPHFQSLYDLTLDGQRIVEDISIQDSKIRPFYALVDGSYLFAYEDRVTLYGEAYYFVNGTFKKVCETDQSIPLV